MGNNTAITISNVSKEYYLYKKPYYRVVEAFHPLKKTYHKSFRALNDISFRVGKGESVRGDQLGVVLCDCLG